MFFVILFLWLLCCKFENMIWGCLFVFLSFFPFCAFHINPSATFIIFCFDSSFFLFFFIFCFRAGQFLNDFFLILPINFLLLLFVWKNHHVRLMTIGCYVVVVARLYDFSWYSRSFFLHFLYFGVFRFSLWIFHVFLYFFDGNDDDDEDDDGTHHKSTILLKNKRWFYINMYECMYFSHIFYLSLLCCTFCFFVLLLRLQIFFYFLLLPLSYVANFPHSCRLLCAYAYIHICVYSCVCIHSPRLTCYEE